ncbi:MAG: thiamine phosphate synthase [Limosilactobacillus pontis]
MWASVRFSQQVPKPTPIRLGLSELTRLNTVSHHPVVAIGGISHANLAATLKAGVAGVAVISMILGSSDITGTVKKMCAAYEKN